MGGATWPPPAGRPDHPGPAGRSWSRGGVSAGREVGYRVTMESGAPEKTTEAKRPVTVFLLDDHEVVRQGLRTLLEHDGEITVIGESGSALEAARRIPALRPDVAVVDVRLPDGTGIEVCRSIRSVAPGIAVLVLTSYDQDEAVFAAIMAGASAYLLKEVNGADLIDAVLRVAAGQSLLDPAVTARVLARLRTGPPTDPIGNHLTPKERQVLALIGEGYTNRQIGNRLNLTEKTTKNYVSAILGKLGVQSRTQAAVIAAHQETHAADPRYPSGGGASP